MQRSDTTSNTEYFVIVAVGMVVIGIVANILNLIVLSLKSMKSTTNKYLWALAVCDLIVLVLSLIALTNSFSTPELIQQFLIQNIRFDEIADIIQDNLTVLDNGKGMMIDDIDSGASLAQNLYPRWVLMIYPRIHPYIYPLAIMFQASTVWISLVMSIDRFIAIHFPLRSLKFCTISNAKKLILLIFILSFVYCSPRFLEFYARRSTLDSIGSKNNSFTTFHTDLTNVGKSKIFRQLVYVWMYIVFQSVIPLIILACINIGLLLSIARSERTTPGVSGDSSRSMNRSFARRDVTLMIITVVLLFIVLQTPSVVCNCVYGTNYHGLAFNKGATGIHMICNVGNIFILTCSSQTFFIYFAFNKKFRKKLIQCVRKAFCFYKKSERHFHKKNSVIHHYAPVVLRYNRSHNRHPAPISSMTSRTSRNDDDEPTACY